MSQPAASPQPSRIAALLARGRFADALSAARPPLRPRLPRSIEAFYEFVGEQDLLWRNPRHPRLRPAEFAAARRALERALPPGAPRELLTGFAELCARRYGAACRRLTGLAAREPRHPQAALLSALALWLRADQRRTRRGVPEALAAAGRAVALAPGPSSWLLRAQILFELERNEPGLADLRRVLRRRPRDWKTRIGRAEILADLHRYRPALRELSRFFRGPRPPWWAYAQRARLRGQCGRLRAGLRDFDAALRRRPGCGALYSWRAEVWRKLGRPEAARADLERALRLDPRYAFSWELRGRLELLAGRPEAARRDLERACRLDPTHQMAFAWRGEARLKSGRLAGALRDFDRVFPLNPATCWNVPGGATRERREAAFWSDVEALRRGRPDDARALLLSGRLKAGAGRLREAEAELSAAAARLRGSQRELALAWRRWALLRERRERLPSPRDGTSLAAAAAA